MCTTSALVIVPASWPGLIAGNIDHNVEALRVRAEILAAAEVQARAEGRDTVHVVSATGVILDVWHVAPGAAKVQLRVILPNVAVGSWIVFPSPGVPFAPGDGHGWRPARVISRKGATARVEWWNRRGVRHECTVSLAKCKSAPTRTAPTPESAAAKLKEQARVVRAERLARRGR